MALVKETKLGGDNPTYDHCGFTIKNFCIDNELECLWKDLRGNTRNIELNCVAADEHEPHIERCIQHLKELYADARLHL